jgi:hypothetical protein
MFWLGLSLGLFAGATIGTVIMAVMSAGKDSSPRKNRGAYFVEDEVMAWRKKHLTQINKTTAPTNQESL